MAWCFLVLIFLTSFYSLGIENIPFKRNRIVLKVIGRLLKPYFASTIPSKIKPGNCKPRASHNVPFLWYKQSYNICFLLKFYMHISDFLLSLSLPISFQYLSPNIQFQFSHSVVTDSLQPHGLQHARLPCPSTTPRDCSNSCHWVGDAIQPSHHLLSPSPPAFNVSQHQGLIQCVGSSHQVAKVLEFQLQHQSFQWTHRTDLL